MKRTKIENSNIELPYCFIIREMLIKSEFTGNSTQLSFQHFRGLFTRPKRNHENFSNEISFV